MTDPDPGVPCSIALYPRDAKSLLAIFDHVDTRVNLHRALV